MKKIVAIVLLMMAVMAFSFAGPAAASNRYFVNRADLAFHLLDAEGNCIEEFSYSANKPFYVIDGYAVPWSWLTAAEKAAFMGRATYFDFQVDGVAQHSVLFPPHLTASDWRLKLFNYEYDQGMTETHTFVGTWYIDGLLVGGTPGEAVLDVSCTSTVTFT